MVVLSVALAAAELRAKASKEELGMVSRAVQGMASMEAQVTVSMVARELLEEGREEGAEVPLVKASMEELDSDERAERLALLVVPSVVVVLLMNGSILCRLCQLPFLRSASRQRTIQRAAV